MEKVSSQDWQSLIDHGRFTQKTVELVESHIRTYEIAKKIFLGCALIFSGGAVIGLVLCAAKLFSYNPGNNKIYTAFGVAVASLLGTHFSSEYTGVHETSYKNAKSWPKFIQEWNEALRNANTPQARLEAVAGMVESKTTSNSKMEDRVRAIFYRVLAKETISDDKRVVFDNKSLNLKYLRFSTCYEMTDENTLKQKSFKASLSTSDFFVAFHDAIGRDYPQVTIQRASF